MKRNGWVWILVVMAVFLMNLPILNALVTSFKTYAEIQSPHPRWLFRPVFSNYASIFHGQYPFPHYFLNSLIVAASAAILVVVVCFPAAYAIARYGTGKRTFFPVVVGIRLMPPIVFAVPYYLLLQAAGLIDTRIGLIAVEMTMNIPIALLLLVGFVQDLPKEVEEAALVDGCSTTELLLRVVLPMMSTGITSVMILTFIFTWNDFLFPLILTITKATTITVGASLFITSFGIQWGPISAAIVLSIIPPLFFAFAAQRYLVKGLSMGAVKG